MIRIVNTQIMAGWPLFVYPNFQRGQNDPADPRSHPFNKSLEDKNRKAWALIGQKIGAMTMTKSELASHPEFVGVIAVDGDFNRFSVMKSTSEAHECGLGKVCRQLWEGIMYCK